MRREDMADLTAFVVVAEEQNFTLVGLGLPADITNEVPRRG